MNSRHSTVCARDHLAQGRPCVCDFGKRAVVIRDEWFTVTHNEDTGLDEIEIEGTTYDAEQEWPEWTL